MLLIWKLFGYKAYPYHLYLWWYYFQIQNANVKAYLHVPDQFQKGNWTS